MSKLFMLVGISGSGKSRAAAELFPGAVIVSSDAIREEIYGDENCQEDPVKVFRIVHERVKQALREGRDVVYDATNLSSKRRRGFLNDLKAAKIDCEKRCIVVVAPIEQCIARRRIAARKVPDYVIWRQVAQFEMPLKSEGWDKIGHIVSGRPYSLEGLLVEYGKIGHDNPHHSLSISEHMYKASEKMRPHSPSWYAARYHDIGKFYTKTFQDRKGNPTDIAHFYNHQNVGAWMWLSSSEAERLYYEREDAEEVIRRIAVAIQFHMDHYIKDSVQLAKSRDKLSGDELILLYEVEAADSYAH